MNIKAEIEKNGRVTITADVDAETAQQGKQLALNHLGQHITAPGFRQGKAPAHVVEKQLKTDKLLEETLSYVAEIVYAKAVEQYKFAPITRPTLSIPSVKDTKTQEEATAILWPSIVQNGVTVNLLTFVTPEIDMSTWRTIVKKTKAPEGKPTIEQAKTLDDAKQKAKKAKPNKAEDKVDDTPKTPEQMDRQLEDTLIEALVNQVSFDLASELIEGETDQMIYRQVETVERLGIPYEDYLKTQNKTWEGIIEELRPEAEKVVRARFIISEIARTSEDDLGEDPKVQDVLEYIKRLNRGELKETTSGEEVATPTDTKESDKKTKKSKKV